MDATMMAGAIILGVGAGMLIALVSAILSVMRVVDAPENADDVLADLGAAISNPNSIRKEVSNATDTPR